MSKVTITESSSLTFMCPGCKRPHSINIAPGGWVYNGNPEKPTFQPSVLVKGGHYASHYDGKGCWCTYYAEHPEEAEVDQFKCGICHSFVTDGQIQFLSDCTHELVNQTVELPEFTD